MLRASLACLTALVVTTTIAPIASAADEAPYTEGSVFNIEFIRVKAGFGDDYLAGLGQTWKKIMDEAKKQGLILSYRVLRTDAANRDDWNLMLMVEYKNQAALDGLEPKMRAIAGSIVGNQDKRREIATKRLEVRENVGGKLAR